MDQLKLLLGKLGLQLLNTATHKEWFACASDLFGQRLALVGYSLLLRVPFYAYRGVPVPPLYVVSFLSYHTYQKSGFFHKPSSLKLLSYPLP
uniref:Uncharacterized protein n=1 Tax=Picea glauca TaxID=3330 RepID=A0A101LXH4_PICGL|nr:hypothetical protein ABT39_MTgene6165 [Picea glauca]